jgi:fumarate reductase subunit C
MAARRPYVRPLPKWWRRRASLPYMAREATAVFVAIYALVLLVGLVRLAQGEAAFEAWRRALRSPESLALHAALLVGMAWHAVTWFMIMPKTMAPVAIGARKLPAWLITTAGIVAASACSIGLVVLAGKLA